ncbi:hypothetical protein KKH05_02260, partial [Patescibacteria group bacterium]|nr:hypothetical protein [Patescibacteria group bacterium]
MAFKFEGTNTGDEELEGVEGEEEASGDVEEGGGGRELSDKEKIDLRKAERAQRNAAWDRLYEDDPEEAQRKEDEIEYICDSISREVGEALDAVSDHRYHIGMADVNRALDRLSVLEYTVREAEEIEMFDDLVKGSIEGYRKQIREAKEACEKRKAELLAKGVEDDTAGRVERKEGDKTLRQIAEDLYTGQWTPEQRAVWDSLTPLEQREVVFITSGWV